MHLDLDGSVDKKDLWRWVVLLSTMTSRSWILQILALSWSKSECPPAPPGCCWPQLRSSSQRKVNTEYYQTLHKTHQPNNQQHPLFKQTQHNCTVCPVPARNMIAKCDAVLQREVNLPSRHDTMNHGPITQIAFCVNTQIDLLFWYSDSDTSVRGGTDLSYTIHKCTSFHFI